MGSATLVRGLFLAVALALAGAPFTARATWSIVIADRETGEVAVGTVTCLTNFDLRAIVPVIVVGKGGAAVQAAGDFDGIRRPIIFDHLQEGTDPEVILELLADISGHQRRQYGIVDTQGRALTFTGSQTFQWAGGVVGSDGSMYYAIQGNILAGDCVVPAIEQAVLNTPGDIPEKLMAGMEAAFVAGGDGRCSCSSQNPTSCGCPPDDFDKAGHIGTMIVARIGDPDDPVCNASGCADGDYFMSLNVAFQSAGRPDPVLQLRELFDEWRADHVGRPDAVQSIVTLDPPVLPADGVSNSTMTIELRDWRGDPIDVAIDSLAIQHAPDSDGLASIGVVTDLGGGRFEVELTAGPASGTDRFRIVADDGVDPVTLTPDPLLVMSNLTGFEIATGDILAGGLPEVLTSDDAYLRTQSGFGRSFTDLHKTEVIFAAESPVGSPSTIDLAVESRIDQPAGSARLSLFDWSAGEFIAVSQHQIGEMDEEVTVADVDAAPFVSDAGDVLLSVRHVVFVPFLAFTFESFFDVVEVTIQ